MNIQSFISIKLNNSTVRKGTLVRISKLKINAKMECTIIQETEEV